ncbi:MAG TPA: hypothetical protein VGB82_13885 [Alphaproteobacteria bacterium]
MNDPIADLKLAANLLATIQTGRPHVDARIKALAAVVLALAEGSDQPLGDVFRSFYSPGDRDAS